MVLKEVAPGSMVTLRISGFSAKVVTVMVCGNEGRRGSADCNLGAAMAVDVPQDRPVSFAVLTMVTPPSPCPCIVQVASERFDEVAAAPFTLLGHPIAEVQETGESANPLQVSIVAKPAEDGFLTRVRRSLGGSSWYDVTVIVKNASVSTVEAPQLSVTAGRGTTEEQVNVVFPAIGDLEAQAVWRHTERAQLPAPLYGSTQWRATATAYALSTTTTTSTENRPTLLVVLGGVFALAVLALLVRLFVRIIRRLVRSQRSARARRLGLAA
jgi:hypothetical protein